MVAQVANTLHICYKFGDVGVWDFAFSSDMPEWVVVRDQDNEIAYEGWVRAFSDSVDENELLLKDVRVCHNKKGGDV